MSAYVLLKYLKIDAQTIQGFMVVLGWVLSDFTYHACDFGITMAKPIAVDLLKTFGNRFHLSVVCIKVEL